MVWHAVERKKDGKLRHPDAKAWQTIDAKFPHFSSETRIARLDANHKWRSDKRRFNGEVEAGTSAPMLTGRQVAEILDGYENLFDGAGRKRKVSYDVNPWNKRTYAIVFLGTLLNIGGKTKDHPEARLDMKDLGIRKALHPTTYADGKDLEIRAAKFDMTNKEKDIFCSVLEKSNFTYGFASNISKCVQYRKILGYKSHDAHIIMQYLLQFAVKGSLKPEVAALLIRLYEFLREEAQDLVVRVSSVSDVSSGFDTSSAFGCHQYLKTVSLEDLFSSLNDLNMSLNKYESIKILILKKTEYPTWKLKEKSEWTPEEKVAMLKDAKVRNILHNSLDSVMSNRVIAYKTAKEICDALKTQCQGTMSIKKNKRAVMIQ
ncbi:hypothetical protein AgCh_035852 [Apium graveolens]